MGRDYELFHEYRDALVRLDELSLQLGHTIAMTRVGWDCPECTSDSALEPINDIARRIGAVMPDSIKATRQTAAQMSEEKKLKAFVRCCDRG